MNGLKMGVIGVGLLAMITGGCQNKVKKENEELWRQNRELQEQRDQMALRLRQAPDAQTLAQLQSENQRLAAEVANLQESLRQQPAGTPTPGLEGIDAVYDAAAGTVTVTLPGDVLFASGSAELRSSAQSTLNKIIQAIKKDYASNRITVRGHTDTDPINKTRDKWSDNWDLGFARAHAVQQYLIKNGISEKNIRDVASAGPNSPKGSKSASRRVEIIVNTR